MADLKTIPKSLSVQVKPEEPEKLVDDMQKKNDAVVPNMKTSPVPASIMQQLSKSLSNAKPEETVPQPSQPVKANEAAQLPQGPKIDSINPVTTPNVPEQQKQVDVVDLAKQASISASLFKNVQMIK